jgi:hypothetical protein
MALEFTTSYPRNSLALLRYYKNLAERAKAQVPDEQLTATLDEEMNSIAIVAKHLAGNMRSRWTDFLTSDGEKPDRNRDTEFDEPPQSRADLLAMWDAGHQPASRALPLSHRPDRYDGEAFSEPRVEIAQRAAPPVGRIQPQSAGSRCKPEIDPSKGRSKSHK